LWKNLQFRLGNLLKVNPRKNKKSPTPVSYDYLVLAICAETVIWHGKQRKMPFQ
jgi:NADH dehydrogenase FAD-containing subunit